MDYRCPVCGENLAKRRLQQAVVVRMQIECAYCNSRIQHNFHPAEIMAVVLGFGTFAALAACAYWLQSQSLMLYAFGAAMASALALPLLERVYLRNWPRYASTGQNPKP
jgi:DNA-directed RNA polymerase subunit RPC12/RpoP